MIRRSIVPLLAIVVLLGSCRTPTPPGQSDRARTDTTTVAATHTPPLPVRRSFCTYCTMSGTIQVHSPQLSAEGTFKLLLAGRDSLQGTVYGPLGILAARSYCTRDELLVFDALAMEAYRVRFPLRSLLSFPIRQEDLFALLRCELPKPDSSYIVAERRADGSAVLLHRDSTIADLAMVDASGMLRAYQRKSLDNRLLFAIEYGDYRSWDATVYPAKVRLAAPQHNMEIVLVPDAIAEDSVRVPFRFRLPSSVRPKTIE
ncbi:MAG: DUF4292 domain-containing protein [Chlorobi bacterium]|nr:DUF4292 domain-containing protein [Chlorobiota bacterium]